MLFALQILFIRNLVRLSLFPFAFTYTRDILACHRRWVGGLSDARPDWHPDQGGEETEKLLKAYQKTHKTLSVWGYFA